MTLGIPTRMDTIARWFAINIVIAILSCLVLNVLFINLAGVWGGPSIADTGLFEQATAITRVVTAAPRPLRSALAAAAGGPDYTVRIYSQRSDLPIPDAYISEARAAELRTLLKRPDATIIGFSPDEYPKTATSEKNYVLAIDLADGSWIAFEKPQRTWGISNGWRDTIIALFVLISSSIVGAIASRRLAHPIEVFAVAADRFGGDVRASPVPVAGPVEVRIAIRAFNAMQDRIGRFVTDRTEMLAAISHDLRAPLTRMRLRGEFVEDFEQQRKLFRDVDEMQAMVDTALGFFREEGEIEQATRFDIAELIHTVIDGFHDNSELIHYQGPARQVYHGRPIALRRALANVIENGVKYGSMAFVQLTAALENIRVVITDRGPGIPQDLHEAVFRPFYRVESSRSKATGGVGLGLSIARSVVRGHGGDVILQNSSARGLIVTIILPVASPARD